MNNVKGCDDIKGYLVIKYNFSYSNYQDLLDYINTQIIFEDSNNVIADIIQLEIIENNNLMIKLKYDYLPLMNIEIYNAIDILIEYIKLEITDLFEYIGEITFIEYGFNKIYLLDDFEPRKNKYNISVDLDIS